MLLKAPIFYTKNPEVVKQALASGTFVVSLEEGSSMFPIEQIPNMTKGTILLPPDELNVLLIDGNEQEFVMNYYVYLNSPVVSEFMALLLYMSYTGMTVTIFDTPKDFDYYANPLLGFLFATFGFITGTEQMAPNMEPTPYKDCQALSLLYVSNLIDINAFMNEIPNVDRVQDFLLMNAVNKAIVEMGCLPDYTAMGLYSYEEINRYNYGLFSQILHDSRHKIVPFIIEEERMM